MVVNLDMDPKKLILLILGGLFAAFIIAGGTLFGIYKYDPALIGIRQPKPQIDSTALLVELKDTIPVTPSVIIDEYSLSALEKFIPENRDLKRRKDSLDNLSMRLIDTIKAIRKDSRTITDSLELYSKVLLDSLNYITFLNDSIAKLNKENSDVQDLLALSKERITNMENYMEQRVDSLEKVNFQRFAKMYENASPEEIARILEKIDERDAAMILKMMQNKKAGKIIEAMIPEQAAAILLLGIE